MDNTETIKKIFEFTKKSELLKETKRWMNTPQMVNKETTAAHSWHLALLVPIIAKELDLDIDVSKSIMLALVHDLVEAIAGDTDYILIFKGFKTEEEKYDAELKAIEELKNFLPVGTGKMIKNIWLEYEKAETREAKFVKALDKIEAINHMIIENCFDYPDSIAPYPNSAVKNFPELKLMLKELHDNLRPEYAKRGWEWKEEYNNY